MYNMIEKSKKNMKNRKGFTLIELIVVIVIIGILAAIIIPRLSGFSDTAQNKANLATARTMYSAAAVLEATSKGSITSTAKTASDLSLVPQYLETDPGSSYTVYTSNGSIVVQYPLVGGGSDTYPK